MSQALCFHVRIGLQTFEVYLPAAIDGESRVCRRCGSSSIAKNESLSLCEIHASVRPLTLCDRIPQQKLLSFLGKQKNRVWMLWHHWSIPIHCLYCSKMLYTFQELQNYVDKNRHRKNLQELNPYCSTICNPSSSLPIPIAAFPDRKQIIFESLLPALQQHYGRFAHSGAIIKWKQTADGSFLFYFHPSFLLGEAFEYLYVEMPFLKCTLVKRVTYPVEQKTHEFISRYVIQLGYLLRNGGVTFPTMVIRQFPMTYRLRPRTFFLQVNCPPTPLIPPNPLLGLTPCLCYYCYVSPSQKILRATPKKRRSAERKFWKIMVTCTSQKQIIRGKGKPK